MPYAETVWLLHTYMYPLLPLNKEVGCITHRGVQHAEVFIFNEFIHISFKMLELGESPLLFRITGEPVSNNAVAVLAFTLIKIKTNIYMHNIFGQTYLKLMTFILKA